MIELNKKYYLILIGLWLSMTVYGQNLEWLKTYGSNGYDAVFASTVFNDKLVISGWFADTMTLDPTHTLFSKASNDGYIATFDTFGNVINTLSYGGNFIDGASLMASTENGIVFCGETSSDQYEILGQTFTKISPSQDIFLCKINHDLDSLEWLINDFNSGGLNYVSSLSIHNNLIVLSGHFNTYQTRVYNMNGNLLWTKTHSNSGNVKSVIGEDGIYILMDSVRVENINGVLAGGTYYFQVRKYNINGDLLDIQPIVTYNPPELFPTFYTSKLHLDKSGNVLLSGSLSDTLTIHNTVYNLGDTKKVFLIKLNPDLDFDWVRIFGTTLDSEVSSIESDGGHYYVGWAETTQTYPYFNILTFDSLGNLLPNLRWTSNDYILGFGLEMINHSLYVSGFFKGEVAFESVPTVSSGFDIFVFKLAPNAIIAQSEPRFYDTNVYAYPNPATSQVRIQTTMAIENLRVFNILGQEVSYNQKIESDHIEMDVSRWPSGLYHVIVNDVYPIKLMIAH